MRPAAGTIRFKTGHTGWVIQDDDSVPGDLFQPRNGGVGQGQDQTGNGQTLEQEDEGEFPALLDPLRDPFIL